MTILWWVRAAVAGPCDDPAVVAERSAAIQAIYDEGEAERADRSAAATSVLERDEARVAQMAKYDRAGELCTAADQWNAAWVMTQADKESTLIRAYEIAQLASNGGHPNGNWLVAYTFDRKRVAGGFLQAYGTQTRKNERGQTCLIEVDPEVTDQTRADYGHPPIADAYRRVLDAAGFKTDEATLDRLERRGLSCKPLAISKKAQRRVVAPD